MCGRFVSSSPPDELARYFGAAAPEVQLRDNYNVAPTSDVYAVRDRAPGPERVLETFHWGLVPQWAKDQKIGNRMINARSETLASKNSFKPALARRRCLIPADGFYEWKVIGTNDNGKPVKQPVFIHRCDDEPIVMAGLWERWRGPDRDWDEALYSTTVITTSANDFMSSIHDRMPVMLAPGDWDEWLAPENAEIDALVSLLVPAPDGLLVAHDVDPRVGNVRNNDAALVDPYKREADPNLFG